MSERARPIAAEMQHRQSNAVRRETTDRRILEIPKRILTTLIAFAFCLIAGSWGLTQEVSEPGKTQAWGNDFRSLGKKWRFQAILGTSPDGTKLLLGRYNTNLAIYDLTKGRVTHVVSARESMQDAAYSPDGTLLAVAEWRDGFSIRDANTLGVLKTFSGTGGLGAWQVRFSPDGNRLFCYSWWKNERQFLCYDLVTNRQIGWPKYQYIDSQDCIVRERLGANSDHLFSVERKMNRGRTTGHRIWTTNATTGKIGRKIELKDRTMSQFDLSPDGKRAVVQSIGEPATIIEMETGNTVATLHGHRRWISGASWSPDGRSVAAVDGTMRPNFLFGVKPPPGDLPYEIMLHDASTGEIVAQYTDHDRKLDFYHVGFSRNGDYIYATTREKNHLSEVLLWGRLPKIPSVIHPLPNYAGREPHDTFPQGSPIKIFTPR